MYRDIHIPPMRMTSSIQLVSIFAISKEIAFIL
nr:MAG TPA: hypothetical protein [Caudoviricetes sp.]